MAKANSTASSSKRASAQSDSPVLKCKTGDIAILLAGKHVGYIVEILEFQPFVLTVSHGYKYDVWHINHPDFDQNFRHCMEDKYLLPIRPGDLDESETDEISLTLGRPA
jgi:hypothetical protein